NQDETRILTWTSDAAHIWDAATGEERLTLDPLSILPGFASIRGAQWNQGANRVLTWDDTAPGGTANLIGGTARIWDAVTGAELLTLPHERYVDGAQWNGDGSHLLTWSRDGTARVWNVVTGELVRSLPGDGTE